MQHSYAHQATTVPAGHNYEHRRHAAEARRIRRANRRRLRTVLLNV